MLHVKLKKMGLPLAAARSQFESKRNQLDD